MTKNIHYFSVSIYIVDCVLFLWKVNWFISANFVKIIFTTGFRQNFIFVYELETEFSISSQQLND